MLLQILQGCSDTVDAQILRASTPTGLGHSPMVKHFKLEGVLVPWQYSGHPLYHKVGHVARPITRLPVQGLWINPV